MVVAPGRMIDSFLSIPDAESLPLYRMVLKLACVIAPYCLSTEDMEEVETFSRREMDVWLQSFTNTQKGVIFTSLLSNAKEWFRKKYFPSAGAYPATSYAELLGLPAGHTILERLDII